LVVMVVVVGLGAVCAVFSAAFSGAVHARSAWAVAARRACSVPLPLPLPALGLQCARTTDVNAPGAAWIVCTQVGNTVATLSSSLSPLVGGYLLTLDHGWNLMFYLIFFVNLCGAVFWVAFGDTQNLDRDS